MSVVTSITSKPIPSRRKRADCFEWSRAGGAVGRCNASINFTLGGGRGRRRIERLEAVHHPTDLNSIRVSISIRTRDAITFLFARRTGRRWINLRRINLMKYRGKNFRNGAWWFWIFYLARGQFFQFGELHHWSITGQEG